MIRPKDWSEDSGILQLMFGGGGLGVRSYDARSRGVDERGQWITDQAKVMSPLSGEKANRGWRVVDGQLECMLTF